MEIFVFGMNQMLLTAVNHLGLIPSCAGLVRVTESENVDVYV